MKDEMFQFTVKNGIMNDVVHDKKDHNIMKKTSLLISQTANL